MDAVEAALHGPGGALHLLLHRCAQLGRPFLLRSEVAAEFAQLCAGAEGASIQGSALAPLVASVQEAVVEGQWVVLALRPTAALWRYVRFHCDGATHEEMRLRDYLALKERLVDPHAPADPLEVDMEPFRHGLPRLRQRRSIGRGMEFMIRHLSARFDDGRGRLVDFLRAQRHRGMPLLLNDRIKDLPALVGALRQGDEYLRGQRPDAEWQELERALGFIGFERGWGRTAAQIREIFSLLSALLEAPDPAGLERFLARVPVISSIVIVSPHGFFAQSDVFGLPDTGGQVVYILDQVRALEEEMRRQIEEQGLAIEPRILVLTRLIPESRGTTCDQRLEPVAGTRNARILRVPFRAQDGSVLAPWISRFEVWPYLEVFAREAQTDVVAELGGRPDLIIGNYSDGNLVATLMAGRLKVTQGAIAHALEKPKYLYSALYWRENEARYHFAAQFTADLINMNAADFIVASSRQEIAGREAQLGQYESYGAFTLPGLYRVINGVDLFDPRFNIIPPGVDPAIYYPYTERRLAGLREEIDTLIYGPCGAHAVGRLDHRGRPLLFTIARLDRIKNIAGLVEWFAHSEELREGADLLLVGGHTRVEEGGDPEEREQIERLHELLASNVLEGRVRWLGLRLDKRLSGELYRCVADTRGLFIQPAWFEAFGLTVIEAMASGLPTFATRYGGPLEIIEEGVSGFLIDPANESETVSKIASFLRASESEPGMWERLSHAGVARVRSHYTWPLHARRILNLAQVCNLWNDTIKPERAALRRYLEMFHALQFRPLARSNGLEI